jgi:hypothetical protein
MIIISQGDNAILTLIAQNGDGTPINLTGASFSTQIMGPTGTPVVFGNSQHTANPDQVDFTGYFTLTLAQTDTANLGAGSNKEIVTLITLNSNQVSFHGVAQLTVLYNQPMN